MRPHPVFLLALMAAPDPGHADPADVKWSEPIEVAAGGAYKGPWRMNASEFHFVDDPTVAINDAGVAGVLFADHARRDIFFQAYGPEGKERFETPVNVSRSPHIFSWLPRLVMTSGDPARVHVLWQEIVFSGGTHGGEIFYARSIDGGKTFGEPVNLSNSIAGDGKGRLTRRYWSNGSLDLAADSDGRLYAAWTEYEGALWFRRSTDGSTRFSEALRIAGEKNAGPARAPALAAAADNKVYIAWTVGEDRSADIHFARSDDGGRAFSRPQPIYESSGHADAPKIAVDSEGTVHLVYAESPAGPGRRYHLRYTRSKDGGRNFEQPREIDAAPAEAYESVNFPSLSLDARDTLYLLWELFPDWKYYPRGLGFTWSDNGGRSFAPPSVVPGSVDTATGINGSQQGLLMRKLAVNGKGAIAAVNSTFNAGKSSHIWLIRGDGN